MTAAATTPAETFAGILTGLRNAIAAAAAKNPLARLLLVLLWSRLGRLARRFIALAARVEAGTAAPRPRRASPHPAEKRARPPYQRLPRRFAWLPPQVPGAAAFGSQLQYWLATEEMAAILAAAPQAGRMLRPLCRMLGVRPPPALAPPPRPARTPAPDCRPAARPSPAAPRSRPPRGGAGRDPAAQPAAQAGARRPDRRRAPRAPPSVPR